MAREHGGLSPDYTDPEATSQQSGVTNATLAEQKRKGNGKIWIGLLIAVVIGFLLFRMPFLAGSLNAGAPAGAAVTGGATVTEDVDTSSTMPTPNEITPSTLPADGVPEGATVAQ